MKYRVTGTIFEIYECDCPSCSTRTHQGHEVLVDEIAYAESCAEAEDVVAEEIAEEKYWDNYGWEGGLPKVIQIHQLPFKESLKDSKKGEV